MRALSSDEIKAIEIDILKDFDRICRENGLRYFLAYGTCLGAMRHHGFIPWDDDIDVDMPRSDYERLYQLFQSGINSKYKLISYRDKSSIYHFFKLIDPSTYVRESYIKDKYTSGIWIDIFPFEESMAGSVTIERAYKKNAALCALHELSVGDPNVGVSKKSVLIKRLLMPLSMMLDPYRLASRIDRLWMGLNDASSANSGKYVCVSRFSRFMLPSNMVFPVEYANFEGLELPVPHDADGYLTAFYKDWRTVPKEEDRPLPHFREVFKR